MSEPSAWRPLGDASIESTGADFTWAPLLVGLPTTTDDLARGRWRFRLSDLDDSPHAE